MFEFVTGLIQPGIVHIEGEKIYGSHLLMEEYVHTTIMDTL